MSYDSDEEDYRQVLQRSVTNPSVDRWGYREQRASHEPAALTPRPAEPGRAVERSRVLERPAISNVLPEERPVREKERSWWDDVTEWFFGNEDAEKDEYLPAAPVAPPPPLVRPIWLDTDSSDDELTPLPPLEAFVRRPEVTRCVLTGDNVEGACLRAEYDIDYHGEAGSVHLQWLRDERAVEFPGGVYPLSAKDVGKVIAVQLTPIGHSGLVGETITVRGPVIRAQHPKTPRSILRSSSAHGPPAAAICNCYCGAIVQVGLRGLHESQFRFQWSRARFPFPSDSQWQPIEGATSRFYQSTMADLNHHLRCTLTPTNAQEAALQKTHLVHFCGLAPLAKTKLREAILQAYVKITVLDGAGSTTLSLNHRHVVVEQEGSPAEKLEWSSDAKLIQTEPLKLGLSLRSARKVLTVGAQHRNTDSVIMSTISVFRLYYAMQESTICVPLFGHALYKAWKSGEVLAALGAGRTAESSALEAALSNFKLPKELAYCWGDAPTPPPATEVQKLFDEIKAHGDHWVRSRDILLAVLL